MYNVYKRFCHFSSPKKKKKKKKCLVEELQINQIFITNTELIIMLNVLINN